MSSLRTLLPLALVACAQAPEVVDAPVYQQAMAPLLVDNERIAQQFLELAGQLKSGKATAETVATRLEEDIQPAATDLAKAAEAIELTSPVLQMLHADLAGAWRARASNYRQMGICWESEDLPCMEESFRANLEVQHAEDIALLRLSLVLREHGYILGPYELVPQTPSTP